MDPSIMKLLEEDEDESMHSGADVEAFTAALNRDIEGGSSSSQHAHADISFSQDNNQMPSQIYSQRQPSSQEENSVNQSQHQALSGQEHLSSEVEKEQGSSMEIQQEVNASQAASGPHTQIPRPDQVDSQRYTVDANTGEVSKPSVTVQPQTYGTNQPQVHEQGRMLNTSNDSQFSNMQRPSSHPVPAPEQGGSSVNRGKQIPFGSLLPIIIPELDKDKAMQLQTLFTKLRKNEIAKDAFVRLMRNIVGDHMLRLAVVKMQAKSQNPSQQPNVRPPAGTGSQVSDPYSFGQIHQKSHSTPTMTRTPVSVMQPVKDSGHQITDRSAISMQGHSNQQQQHLHFPQGSFPMYAATSYHPHTGTNVSAPSTLANPQSHEPQIRQGQYHQGFGSAHGGSTSHTMNVMNTPKFESHNSINDSRRIPGATMANMGTPSMQHAPVPWQVSKDQMLGTSSTMNFVKQEVQGLDKQQKPQVSSSQGPYMPGVVPVDQGESLPGLLRPTNATPSSVSPHMDANFQVGSQNISADAMGGIGNNSKASAKKPSSGQKKPLDALASSPPLPGKKQKVSGTFSDQSIEHLNDVTAVSGVNLREEEEQLLSGPKDDSKVSEASRKAVQEEEDRLILQKAPLQKKLAEIMTKYGLKNLSNDVERCLSLCVEERMRGLISSLIRVSKQRADSEKSRHNTVVTSDVREQIMAINRKAREEWDKKQAGLEKLRKQNEQPDSSAEFDVDKDKDDGRAKSLKMQVNKEEDDKMRTTAANVAARAAVGGDDMLSKWQLMAQARQKRDGGPEIATSSQAAKDVTNKQAATSIRNVKETSGAGKRDLSTSLPASVTERQSGRSQVIVPPPRVAPCISVKDVIAVLEREPQMAKSTIIYRLYDRVHTDPTAE